jgi:hypothetical protein
MNSLIRCIVLLCFLCFNVYAQTDSLNTFNKWDEPYYTMYDEDNDELIIAGCRIHDYFGTTNLFVARLDNKGEPLFVKEFVFADTNIMHVGGIFKEQNGWRVFVTGLNISDTNWVLGFNMWFSGYLMLNKEMDSIIGSEFFETTGYTHTLGNDLRRGGYFMQVKKISQTQNEYFGIINLHGIRGYNRWPYVHHYWHYSEGKGITVLSSDSITSNSDFFALNDSIVFAVNNDNWFYCLKWFNTKTKQVYEIKGIKQYTDNTKLDNIPLMMINPFTIAHHVAKYNDTSFVMFARIVEDLESSYRLDSVRNFESAQYMLGVYKNFVMPIFDTSILKSVRDSFYFTPISHVLTESRKPAIPVHSDLTAIAASQPLIADSKKGKFYVVQQFGATITSAFDDIFTDSIRISCYGNDMKLYWKYLITGNGKNMFNESPLSIVSNPKTGGFYLINRASKTTDYVVDELFNSIYYPSNIKIYSFDSTGFQTSVNQIQLNKPIINIYPNPSNTVLHLQGELLPHATIEVYNITGVKQHVAILDNDKVDVSSLEAGVYLLRVTQGSATITKKFIKQ